METVYWVDKFTEASDARSGDGNPEASASSLVEPSARIAVVSGEDNLQSCLGCAPSRSEPVDTETVDQPRGW